MKYTIESTENGCVETLEVKDGRKFVCEIRRNFGYYEGTGPSIADQLEKAGFDDEIVKLVDGMFGGIMEADFIDLSEFVRSN